MEEQNTEEPAQSEEQKDTVSLGGNIQLTGFQNVENAKSVVLKKMIGSYVRQIQEKREDYEKIVITLEGDENNPTIKITLTAGGNEIAAEESTNNLFTALDTTLKKIMEQI